MGLFDAPTGGSSTPLTSGSPAYQDAIVSGAERQLKPRYQQALKSSRQSFSDRGQLGGGEDKAAQLGLQENFLGQVGDIATGAATKGADLTEENRRREESRGWEVQDRDKRIEELNRMAEQEREGANQNMWGNLIGGAAGALGGALAGPVGAGIGSLAARYATRRGQAPAGENIATEQSPGYTPF